MNKNIKGMYDMANSNNNELSKFEEQKLLKQISNNKKLFAKNKDLFAEEKRLTGCSMYYPCPICDKCLNKASHLYVRCENCGIPICVHTNKDKMTLIKRKNFKIKVSEKTFNILRNLSKDILEQEEL